MRGDGLRARGSWRCSRDMVNDWGEVVDEGWVNRLRCLDGTPKGSTRWIDIHDGRLVDTRLTMHYVLVELLRNVVQHSGDALGAVVRAQLMDRGRGYDRPVVQVAVADCGHGLLDALVGMHPALVDPREAINLASLPFVSGQFPLGGRGTAQKQGARRSCVTRDSWRPVVGGRGLMLRPRPGACAPRR